MSDVAKCHIAVIADAAVCRAGKNLGFLEKVFRFLGFVGFLRFLRF